MTNRMSDARRVLSQGLERLNHAHPSRRLRSRHQELSLLRQRLGQMSPHTGLASARAQWERMSDRLGRASVQRLSRATEQLETLGQRLDAASPRAVLERGYTFVVDEMGKPLTSAQETVSGQSVKLHFADGQRRARIEGDEDV